MRPLTLALWMVLTSFSLVGAQTVTLDVDKGAIVGLGTQSLLPYELDGNPGTREFVQFDKDPATQQTLIRTITTGGCIRLSDWFNPWNFVTLRPFDFWVTGALLRAGDRDRFVYTGQQTYGELTLPVGCQ